MPVNHPTTFTLFLRSLRGGPGGRSTGSFAKTSAMLPVFVLGLLAVHAGFTAAVRGYVVPRLTPAAHWQFGLQRDSDSQVFQEQAAQLASQMRAKGWRTALREPSNGVPHTKILATIYYLAGSDHPVWAYAFNGLLYALTGLLVAAVMLQCGVGLRLALAGAALISLGPMHLFAHSELLREPYIILTFLVETLGLLMLIGPDDAQREFRGAPRRIAGALLYVVGFVGTATLRPYLTLLMYLGLAFLWAATMLYPLVVNRVQRQSWSERAVFTSMFLALGALWVGPQLASIQKYSDNSVTSQLSDPAMRRTVGVVGADGLPHVVDADAWRAGLEAKGERPLERTALVAPHWCTVVWRDSPWLPDTVDRKLEALACAREDFLRFCDVSLLGNRADRYCDEVNFDNATELLRHVPAGMTFALLVPFPRMWLDGFGSGGTGLRRLGYLVDGVLDYVLLAGLPMLVWLGRRTRPDLGLVTVAIVLMLTVYGLSVPSQFILARMRLAMYTPLLSFGFAGWLLAVRSLTERLTEDTPAADPAPRSVARGR